jgi:hypothetical protein
MLGRSAEVGCAGPSPRDGDIALRSTDGDQVRCDVVGRREDLIGGSPAVLRWEMSETWRKLIR